MSSSSAGGGSSSSSQGSSSSQVGSSSSAESSSSTVGGSSSSSESSSSSSLDPCNGDTFQVREKITELPIVSTAENGSGYQYRTRDVYDEEGKLTWQMDARGYIRYYLYDGATGAMLRQIDDVDTSEIAGVPLGWATPEGGGLGLVTDYEIDSQGRTLKVLGPSFEAQLHVGECDRESARVRTVQYSVYRDDIREEWSASGYARGNGPAYTFVTVGMVRVMRKDFDGNVVDEIESIRECPCGPLSDSESFPQENWKRWTKHLYDQWGRLRATRVYHAIPDSGEGEKDANYNETTYGYDAFGRRNRMVSPGGTITRTVYDALDRAREQWVGTDDSGATDLDPDGNNTAGNNMVKVSFNEYDAGDEGEDGNLTQEVQVVNDTSGDDRETDYLYDFRNRLVDTESSDGISDFFLHNLYDNLDRSTGQETYHTAVDSGNLTGRALVYHDSRGQVFKEETYSVDPDTGTASNTPLVSQRWYDASGSLVKSIEGGSEAISVLSYDSLGRETMSYLAYAAETPSSSSSSSYFPPSSSSNSSSSSLIPSSSNSSSSSSLNSSSSSSSSFFPVSSSSSSGPPMAMGAMQSSGSSSSSDGFNLGAPQAYYNFQRTSGFLKDVVGSLDMNVNGASNQTGGKYKKARHIPGGFSSNSDPIFNPGTANAVTISFWFWIDTIGGGSPNILLEKEGEYQIVEDGDVTFKIATGSGTGWDKTVTFSSSVNPQEWHQVVVWIIPGDSIGISVDDGDAEFTSLASGESAYTGGGVLRVGYSSSGTDGLEGRMDELAFFDSQLGIVQRNELYNSGDGTFWKPEDNGGNGGWGPGGGSSSSSGSPPSSSDSSSSSSSSSVCRSCSDERQGCGCGEEMDEETGECYTSPSPVRLANGQIVMSETDLSSRAFGFSWGHTRSYGNLADTTTSGINGNQWLVNELGYLAFGAGESEANIALMRGANDSLWFEPDGYGGWRPEFASRNQLIHDVAAAEYVLIFARGSRMVFYDNSSGVPAALRGQLKSSADRYGNLLSVFHNALHQTEEVEQSNGVESSVYRYTYLSGGDNAGLLESVVLEVNGQDVRRVQYDYYESGDDGGSSHDLKRVTLQEYDTTIRGWRILRQSAYLYYLASDPSWPNGFAHGLKFELQPENYQRMVDAGLDPFDPDQAEAYADKYFEYNAVTQQVSKEAVRGGELVYTFNYETNPDDPGFGDYNIWEVKTVLAIDTPTGGKTTTVYSNKSGVAMLVKTEAPKFREPTTTHTWYRYTRFNGQGRVSSMATPSAIASVSEPDVSGGDNALVVSLNSSAGLIRVNTFYSTTNPATGAVATYLETRGVQEGSGGAVAVTERKTYTTHTVSGVSIHPPASHTSYPEAGGSGDTTSYRYCYYDTQNESMGYFGPITLNPDNLGNVSDLVVVEQNATEYDGASHPVLATNWQRFHDAIGNGALQGPNGDQPKARRSYTAQWYDGAVRPVAAANYGTNGGAEVERSSLAPDRSETILVNTTHYKGDGEANATVDADGKETRWDNDDAGRRIRMTENYQACDPGPDANRITEYAYAPDGGMSRLTLRNDVTGDQVTRWIYGVEKSGGGSDISRSDLLRAKVYPESDDRASNGDGPDDVRSRTEYDYNRQGNVTRKEDPNGTVHEYEFDQLGRTLRDRVTTFATGIDQTVKRIQTTYDTKRLLTSAVGSYNDDSAGTLLNEVAYTYDGFGQLTSDAQAHSGAVDSNTPSVSYGYENGSADNTARRKSITYPDDRIIDLKYGDPGSGNDKLSRIGSLQVNGETEAFCTYDYVGAGRYVKIAFPEPGVQLSYEKTSTMPLGDAGDPYTGYDRFGRTVDMRWVTISGELVRDRIQYGYDPSGNRTWRRNLAATAGGQDNAWSYDGLDQVKEASLGTLNLNQTAIGSIPAEQEVFDYDPTGNWTHYERSADGSVELDQSRVSNRDNQMTQIDGSSDGIAYDEAGNATKMPPGDGEDWGEYRNLVWDAWNRLVEVKDDEETTIATYAYDGLTRRITKTVDSTIRSYFYNDRWKSVEERVGASADPAVQYLWGERPDHRDELIRRDRDSNDDGALNERLFFLMDYFNPTSVVNDSGAVVERYRFSAFGQRTIMEEDWEPLAQSAYAVEFGFQGQFEDEETGYYNYGYRYYVPSLGRWINRDPIGEEGGNNLYAFTGNGPINGVDRFGLYISFYVDGTQDDESPVVKDAVQYLMGSSLFREAWGWANKGPEEGGVCCIRVNINFNSTDSANAAANSIEWDPSHAHVYLGYGGNLIYASPARIFFHELLHIYRARHTVGTADDIQPWLDNMFDYDKYGPLGKVWSNREEYEVIQTINREIKSLGSFEGTRVTHNGGQAVSRALDVGSPSSPPPNGWEDEIYSQFARHSIGSMNRISEIRGYQLLIDGVEKGSYAWNQTILRTQKAVYDALNPYKLRT